MKQVRVSVKNGKVEIDFEGFPNKACDTEELLLRSLFEKMGVVTNDKNSKRKEREKEPIIEKEKVVS